MSLLSVQNLSKYFGGVAAVNGLSMEIEKGELRGLIGPNGAGKTTAFNTISGALRANAGTVVFDGKDVTGMKANQISREGLVRTFQRDAIFHEFTVLENVRTARHVHATGSVFTAVFGRASRMRHENVERAAEIVDVVGLTSLKDEVAANLPHGHQRLLGVGIALAAEPKLLMLDEPVTGMNPAESETMSELIERIRTEFGITVLLVEHNMRTVMNLCEKITVLDFGRQLAEGSPEEIQNNPEVIEAYLGAEDIVA